ncbi:LLM class flavin-dependent oxidoreductase [Saccharibacillus sp. CPCC 101409]|uniref:LLM class flavin-dependent oxidoreductase n=1 Tax=Saccharibacillus sp. CPCC 101409 TaxID=3058041 RepID=UPI002672E60E|nr:LLM class flavin-dependent oxidoreductase [Saccharibacillus sp. CPCC 101409]MDO3408565.1 LLM class flavin-dependent oxidoreductase [Saccharibacillus sp. CPCC 101409]
MTNMALGILDMSPQLGGATAEEALRQSALLARSAEEWGYTRYWLSEHHGMDSLACTAPEVMLAHIGAQTQRIRIGAGAVLLPHYSPLKVAECFNLLSALYPGRIDLGVGRAPGGDAHTTMALSGNFLAHVGEMPGKVRELCQLMDGSYRYDGEPVRARPQPAEPPELWMLGTNTKSADMAASCGAYYAFGQFMSSSDGPEIVQTYRDAFQPSEQRERPHVMVAVHAICAETDSEALTLAEKFRAQFPDSPVGRPDLKGTDDRLTLIVGNVQRVRERLHEIRDAYEADEIMIVCPAIGYAERLESFRLTAVAAGIAE